MKIDFPVSVLSVVRKLGHDIQQARRKRRIGTALMAERAGISRTTLNKIEKGEPGVALGNYATVLFVLGMLDRFADLFDPSQDSLGLDLDAENLPKRIRQKKLKEKS